MREDNFSPLTMCLLLRHDCPELERKIKEKQDRVPTLYWLPKLHKRPYKARFIAYSSFCTTTVLSKLLTSCLTAVKKHWIRYYDTVYERDGINYFWSIKNSNDVLNKFKSKNFQASKLSTYDFSTLYTTLPHHLVIDKPWLLSRFWVYCKLYHSLVTFHCLTPNEAEPSLDQTVKGHQIMI